MRGWVPAWARHGIRHEHRAGPRVRWVLPLMSTSQDDSKAPERGLALPAGLLAATLMAWGVVSLSDIPSPPVVRAPAVDSEPLALPSLEPLPAPDPRVLFEGEVRPLLEASAERHAAAIDHTLELVELEFREYRRGVEPFVRDLTSIGTRGGVLVRSARDLVGDRDRVSEYVSGKFERYLFTDEELTEFLELAVQTTLDAFEADRNKLLRDVSEALDGAGLPELQLPDYAEFAETTSTSLQTYAAEMATESAVAGVGALVASEAAAVMVTQLLARALPLLAVSAGGATAAATTTGGTTGTLAGPVGTGIGLVGGFAVGMAVDSWLTEELSDDLTAQMRGLVDQIRTALIDGDAETPGLRQLLEEHAELLGRAREATLEQAVVGS